MKQASSKLYDLIQQMTPGEKRYFLARSSLHGRKNPHYIVLFEHIAQMREWKEEALLEKIEQEEWSNKLAFLKHYLWKKLLDSLAAYHRSHSPEGQLITKLQHADVLMQKFMWKAAWSELKAAKKEVEDRALYAYYPQIAQLERKYLEANHFRSKSAKLLEQWYDKYEEASQQLEEAKRNTHLLLRVTNYHISGQQKAATLADMEPLLKEAAHKPLKNWRAQIDYWQAKATFHFAKKQTKEALEANLNLSQILEANLQNDPRLSRRYLSVFHNLLIDQLQLGMYAELKQGIQKLHSISEAKTFKNIPKLDSLIFQWTTSLELNALLAQQHYASSPLLLNELIQKFHHFADQLAPQAMLSLRYLLALFCFYGGQFKDALALLVPFYQEQKPELVAEIYHYARVVLVITHYELGHDQLVESLLRAEKRRLQQNNIEDRVLHLLWYYLEKLLDSSPTNKPPSVIKKWLKALESIELNEKERQSMAYFDYKYYLEKKISE